MKGGSLEKVLDLIEPAVTAKEKLDVVTTEQEDYHPLFSSETTAQNPSTTESDKIPPSTSDTSSSIHTRSDSPSAVATGNAVHDDPLANIGTWVQASDGMQDDPYSPTDESLPTFTITNPQDED